MLARVAALGEDARALADAVGTTRNTEPQAVAMTSRVLGVPMVFEQILRDLTGARLDLKKGAIAGVRLDGRRGTLIALLRPREIARIGC